MDDCERGCRFFDYAQTSGLSSDLNATAFHSLCVGSKYCQMSFSRAPVVFTTQFLFTGCDEAYSESDKRGACLIGCDSAKEELKGILEVPTNSSHSSLHRFLTTFDRLQMSTKLLEEADKQMNFFNSFFDMMSSSFWSMEEDDDDDDKDLGRFGLLFVVRGNK